MHAVLADPLISLEQKDKSLLWGSRYTLRSSAALLPRFLASVNWFDAVVVAEARKLLYTWTPPTYVEALQMLDCRCEGRVNEFIHAPINASYHPGILSSIYNSSSLTLTDPLNECIHTHARLGFQTRRCEHTRCRCSTVSQIRSS